MIRFPRFFSVAVLGMTAFSVASCGGGGNTEWDVDDGTTYVYDDPVYYGSLAVNHATHSWSLVTQAGTQRDADAQALAQCVGACTVAERFTGCAAVTQSPDLSLYTGTGRNLADAQSSSRQICDMTHMYRIDNQGQVIFISPSPCRIVAGECNG